MKSKLQSELSELLSIAKSLNKAAQNLANAGANPQPIPQPKAKPKPQPKKKRAASLNNSIRMQFKLIPAGSFAMGSPNSEPDRLNDETQHPVQISRSFYMGKHTVTIGQFKQFIAATGHRTTAERNGYGWEIVLPGDGVADRKGQGQSWKFPGIQVTDQHPVTQVSWNDAIAFTNWLSQKEGKRYRLPTEAEWEYSARAGTKTPFITGRDFSTLLGKANLPKDVGQDRFYFSSPVGSFSPNRFGLYDVHGNVWEWCLDSYDPNFYANGKEVNPVSTRETGLRVFRGGCFL